MRADARGGGDVVCAANIRFRRIVLTSNIVKLKFGNSKGNIGELLNTTSEHSRTDTRPGLTLEGLEDSSRNNKGDYKPFAKKIRNKNSYTISNIRVQNINISHFHVFWPRH